MGRVTLNYKLKPLFALDGNWTKVCNTMIFYIPDAYTFKIYVYLCYRYNNEYQYAFPSLNTIAKDTNISKRKVQESIKWLEKKRFIVKKYFKNNQYTYMMYYILKDNATYEKDENLNYILIPNDEEEYITTYIEEEKEIKTNNKNKRKVDYKYIKWRKDVLERDDYKCKLCGKTKDETILNVHHIVRYADNEELRTDINNGISLCYECHKKILGKEKEFEEYFKQLIQNK